MKIERMYPCNAETVNNLKIGEAAIIKPYGLCINTNHGEGGKGILVVELERGYARWLTGNEPIERVKNCYVTYEV